MTSRHRQEVELEAERAKQTHGQLEKTQLAREKAHKQRVKGLEEQVITWKTELQVIDQDGSSPYCEVSAVFEIHLADFILTNLILKIDRVK